MIFLFSCFPATPVLQLKHLWLMCTHNWKMMKQIFFSFHRYNLLNGSWNLTQHHLWILCLYRARTKSQTKSNQPTAKPALLVMPVYLTVREVYRWAVQWTEVNQSLWISHRFVRGSLVDQSLPLLRKPLCWSDRRTGFKQLPVRLCYSSFRSWDPEAFYSSSINGSLCSAWYPQESLPFLAVCLIYIFSVCIFEWLT